MKHDIMEDSDVYEKLRELHWKKI